MIYITLLDQFHPGIYKSQVIDVCRFLSDESGEEVKLVPFLSIREMMRSDNVKQIKKLYPNSLVLPAFPGLGNYRLTAIFLAIYCLLSGERKIMARNAFATTIALMVKRIGLAKKVLIDVRSSLTAEIHEYDSFPNTRLRKAVELTERKAILEADFRIAVSNQMVAHWRSEYAYNDDNHVVIPCTLNRKVFDEHQLSRVKIAQKRSEMGYSDSDIVLIFSGSNAPWQGEKLKNDALHFYLAFEQVKLIFLSKENSLVKELQGKYPGRVQRFWLSHEEVPDFLQAGDYGLLIREQSITNKVASPAKFAEYLAAGLKVLISENLGDFSEMARRHRLGQVLLEDARLIHLESVSFEDKVELHNFSKANFSKEFHNKEYGRILEKMA